MWYPILFGIIAVWVLWDGMKRKLGGKAIAWAIGVFLAGPLILPIYLAKRPLQAGEIREGGTAWGVLKNFAVFWTLTMVVATVAGMLSAGQHASTLTNDAEKVGAGIGTALGLGMLFVIWFVPTLGAALLGFFLRKNSVMERGPTGPLLVGALQGAESSPVFSQPSPQSEALSSVQVSTSAVTQPNTMKWVIAACAAVVLIIGLIAVGSRRSGNNPNSNSTTGGGPILGSKRYYLTTKEEKVLTAWSAFSLSSQPGTVLVSFEDYDSVTAVTAKQVSDAYEENQVAADQSYYQKKLVVRGTVASINSGFGNEPYLVLDGGRFLGNVNASFTGSLLEKLGSTPTDPSDTARRVATLRKGQKVTLVCIGGGALAGFPSFRDCVFGNDYSSAAVEKRKKTIRDVLSGRQPANKDVAAAALEILIIARLVPDTSPCLDSFLSAACNKDLEKPADPNSRLVEAQGIVKEFQARGVDLSAGYTQMVKDAEEDSKKNK